MKRLVLAAVVLFSAAAAGAVDYVLPIFALSLEGERGTVWSSEVYVTNPGPGTVTVREGGFLPGARDITVQCLPIAQPFINVPPHSTVLWSSRSLALGVGCPVWAIGGLMFQADAEVHITSRIVNTTGEPLSDEMLHGLGQEIPALFVKELAADPRSLLLPGVAWHPNSCGPTEFDTNVFLTNPGEAPAVATISAVSGGLVRSRILVNGTAFDAPFEIIVPPFSEVGLRVAGPDAQISVCLPPVAGTFLVTTTGTLAVIGSVVDRTSGDPRTVLPIDLRE